MVNKFKRFSKNVHISSRLKYSLRSKVFRLFLNLSWLKSLNSEGRLYHQVAAVVVRSLKP